MAMRKILLIDDERDFTELTGTLLDFHELSVDTVNDPLEAIKAAEKTHYDLIVTDIMMPNMNGFELIENLRRLDNYRKTPIIVLTAKQLSDEERKILLRNDVHFQMKPFEPLGLVEQIRQLVGG
jgi:CheY-like chemotaxis protein